MPRYEVKWDVHIVKHITANIDAASAKEAIALAQDGEFDESDDDGSAPVDVIDQDNFKATRLK